MKLKERLMPVLAVVLMIPVVLSSVVAADEEPDDPKSRPVIIQRLPGGK